MSSGPERTSASDADLIRAVARGDEDACADLYDRYSAILLGIALRILRDQAEAEDVLQEIFLQIWQRAATFDEARGRALPWLALLARSRALDRLRSRNFRGRAAAEAAAEPEAPVPEPVEGAIGSEESRAVRNALAEISAAQRTALLLGYFEGLSQSEIAARLDKPLGTVKTHMRLGLTRLRKLLDESFKLGEPGSR